MKGNLGSWILDSRYWIPDSSSAELGFQALVGFRIPQAKISRNPEFSFSHMERDNITQSENITLFLLMEVKFLQFITNALKKILNL